MKALFILLSSCVLAGLTGCSPMSAQDMTAAIAALKGDPASVCLSVTGMYGTVTVVRTNQPGTTVEAPCHIAHGTNPVAQAAPTVVAIPLAPGEAAHVLH